MDKKSGTMIIPEMYFEIEDIKHILSRTQPVRNNLHEIVFLTKGHLIRNINLRSIQVNSHEFHLALKNQLISVEGYSQDVSGFYCCFSDQFLESMHLKNDIDQDLSFISSYMYHYPLRLPKNLDERMNTLFTFLWKVCRQEGGPAQLHAAYLLLIIREIRQLMVNSGFDPYPSKSFLLVKRYTDLLVEHIRQHRNVSFYAEKLGVTTDQLNKAVKATLGKTSVTLCNEICLSEAKFQLKRSYNPVSDIAYLLGFSEPTYFNRFFKKLTGKTPLEYRNNPL